LLRNKLAVYERGFKGNFSALRGPCLGSLGARSFGAHLHRPLS
jgi:hypothetical protein